MPGTLQTQPSQLVLEQFFKDCIVPWYQERIINATTYEKARKEVDLLKEKKTKQKKDSKVQKITRSNIDDGIHRDKDSAIRVPSNSRNPQTNQGPDSAKAPVKQHAKVKPETRCQHCTKVEANAQHENAELRQKLSTKKDKINTIRADAGVERITMEDELERLRKALNNSNAKVDELTNRLSQLVGDKLRHGNPNIADLSDTNRPTELGKRFSELYDNEWSDAFEHIDEKHEDKKVGILHGIIMKAFAFCEQKSEEQLDKIGAVLLAQEDTSEKHHKTPKDAASIVPTTTIHNMIKDTRKKMANKTSANIANEFISGNLNTFVSGFYKSKKMHPTLKTYASNCAELCWFMVVCDPPMSLSEDKEGKAFDTKIYKPYTKAIKGMKQPVVQLHVWPALHLHLSGHLVAKGVAQPGEKGEK